MGLEQDRVRLCFIQLVRLLEGESVTGETVPTLSPGDEVDRGSNQHI